MKIGISIDPELYEWLLQRTGAGREFASISHAVERSVASYQTKRLPLEPSDDGAPPPE